MCLDQWVVVTVELVSQITGFPKNGPHPSQYFQGKENKKILATKLKKKYELERDGCTYVVDNINERALHIAVRILSRKVVWKHSLNQCTSGVVSYAEQCDAVVQMSWSLFC